MLARPSPGETAKTPLPDRMQPTSVCRAQYHQEAFIPHGHESDTSHSPYTSASCERQVSRLCGRWPLTGRMTDTAGQLPVWPSAAAAAAAADTFTADLGQVAWDAPASFKLPLLSPLLLMPLLAGPAGRTPLPPLAAAASRTAAEWLALCTRRSSRSLTIPDSCQPSASSAATTAP